MTINQGGISWAAESMKMGVYSRWHELFRVKDAHWSRVVEYPWIMLSAGFRPADWVLDAGGGHSVLGPEVVKVGSYLVNLDLDLPEHYRQNPGIYYVRGDLRRMPYPDGCFNKVICVSVIEHILNPVAIVRELWRVTAPGGRLLLTIDVADNYRWNHTVDMNVAGEIAGMFGLALPQEPKDILTQYFPEYERKEGEAEVVLLKVLCLWCDKPRVE